MAVKISVFIPVYNARALIKENFRRISQVFEALREDLEIIIVDDNSTDCSCRLGRAINRGKGRARYLFYDKGPSRRENLAKSFSQANGDIICFIDADFSFDLSYLLKAIEMLKAKKADITIGSRYVPGALAQRRVIRRIFSFFYNLLIRILFGSRLLDHQCGLKVFRKEAVMPTIKEMGYDATFTRGWFWDAELLIRAQKKGLKIIEMPLEWHWADKSTFNFFREIKSLKWIYRLKKELG